MVGAMWEVNGKVRTTRYRLDPCGQAPISWGAKGAPAAPVERSFGAALRGHANRAADVREAWRQQQFPPLPQQTAQQSEQLQELIARMAKMEDKMEQLVA